MANESVNQKLLDDTEMGFERDWRRPLKAQRGFKIMDRTFRGQSSCFLTVVIAILVIMFLYYLLPKNAHSYVSFNYYNNTYPLSNPIIVDNMYTFRIGIIADLDTNSKSKSEPNTWFSYLKKGYLSFNPAEKSVVVTWDEGASKRLTSSYSLKDRGMELSELVVFNGRLLSFDDRTGIIYEIVNDNAVPWVLLMDGDGRNAKGFKSEWATVKDEFLYVGSMGKEWTTSTGEFENYNPMYIKKVSTKGEVFHLNWVNEYKKLREQLDIQWPGYMIHESGAWSNVHKRWFFLPRRCSKDTYNEVTDEHMGCSFLISADPEVYNLRGVQIKNSIKTRGFSSFKFVPYSDDTIIVALRTEELNGTTATYITCFTVDGEIIVDDTLITSELKFEGLEFI